LLPLRELLKKTPLVGLELGSPSGVLGDMLVELVGRKMGDGSSRNGHIGKLLLSRLVNSGRLAVKW